MKTRKEYTPREDFVLFRVHEAGMLGKLAMPQMAEQGKKRLVTAVGPQVKDLSPGDEVIVIGGVGSCVELIEEKGLYLTRQSNVCCTVRRLEADE